MRTVNWSSHNTRIPNASHFLRFCIFHWLCCIFIAVQISFLIQPVTVGSKLNFLAHLKHGETVNEISDKCIQVLTETSLHV